MKIDSPKIRLYNVESALTSFMMARTLTGSVAEISAPKAKLSAIDRLVTPSTQPIHRTMAPITAADMKVPVNAYAQIAPKFLKNALGSIPYPLSKIIGGRRNRRKTSTFRCVTGESSCRTPIRLKNPLNNIPRRVATPAS